MTPTKTKLPEELKPSRHGQLLAEGYRVQCWETGVVPNDDLAKELARRWNEHKELVAALSDMLTTARSLYSIHYGTKPSSKGGFQRAQQLLTRLEKGSK